MRSFKMILVCALYLLCCALSFAVSENDDIYRSESLAKEGASAFRIKEYRDARKLFEKAISIRKESAAATYYLAKIYISSGDKQSAKDLLNGYFASARTRTASITDMDKKYLPKLEDMRKKFKLGPPSGKRTGKTALPKSTVKRTEKNTSTDIDESMDEFIK